MASSRSAPGWALRARKPARAKVIDGPETASQADFITPGSPAAQRQLQTTPVSSRSPLPWGQASPHWGRQRSRAWPKGSAKASPKRCRRAIKAANRAGGSGTWCWAATASSSSAIPGSASSTLRLASDSNGSARIRAKASTNSSSNRPSAWPAARANTAFLSSTWPASQREKGSLSQASRCTNSLVGRPISSFTGAENWRNSDRLGGWESQGRPSRRRCCSS